MMKMNFTNDQAALEYATYMIIGSYFKKVICDRAKLQEQKLFLHYQEQKREVQYYLEEQCIAYAEKVLMNIFPEEIWEQEMVVHFKRLPNDKNAICFEGKRGILILSVERKGNKKMEFKNSLVTKTEEKMVQYQWIEDGEVELCKIKEGILGEEKSCYHCNRKMQEGEKAIFLNPQDGDEYIICQNCGEKACKSV